MQAPRRGDKDTLQAKQNVEKERFLYKESKQKAISKGVLLSLDKEFNDLLYNSEPDISSVLCKRLIDRQASPRPRLRLPVGNQSSQSYGELKFLYKETSKRKMRRSASANEVIVENGGHLYFRQKGKKFQKSWVVLSGNLLRCYKQNADVQVDTPVAEIPLDSAAVKKKNDFIFIIVTSETLYTFKSVEERSTVCSWVNFLSRRCSRLVFDYLSNDESEDFNVYNMQEIKYLAESNVCADCGASHPEWTSLNLGIFICEECCGAHRSFGSHISKIQSVYADSWTHEQIEMLKKKGNGASNRFWEYNVTRETNKITPQSTRTQRIQWLTEKYIVGRYRKDYIPVGPTKFCGKQNVMDEFKSIFIENLQEDKSFREEAVALIFGISPN